MAKIIIADDGTIGSVSDEDAIAIDATGNVTLTQNLVMGADGKGIDFSASEGGGASSSLLDDYEEGTYTITITPATSGTVTVNSSYDTVAYTKIGRLVTVHGRIRISAIDTPSGNLQFSLPFTVGSPGEESGYVAGAIVVEQVSSAALYLTTIAAAGAAFFQVAEVISADYSDIIDDGDISGNEFYTFSLTYSV